MPLPMLSSLSFSTLTSSKMIPSGFCVETKICSSSENVRPVLIFRNVVLLVVVVVVILNDILFWFITKNGGVTVVVDACVFVLESSGGGGNNGAKQDAVATKLLVRIERNFIFLTVFFFSSIYIYLQQHFIKYW
mmetsp:Transcript_35800/g.52491  ORF Transcript_35800/g.52491 Transcript_35800/m.52491 type:complete len:134 (+) Transcript_35800:240-641(+)